MGSTITSMSDDTSQTTTVDELSETMRSYASELRDLKDDLEQGRLTALTLSRGSSKARRSGSRIRKQRLWWQRWNSPRSKLTS